MKWMEGGKKMQKIPLSIQVSGYYSNLTKTLLNVIRRYQDRCPTKDVRFTPYLVESSIDFGSYRGAAFTKSRYRTYACEHENIRPLKSSEETISFPIYALCPVSYITNILFFAARFSLVNRNRSTSAQAR